MKKNNLIITGAIALASISNAYSKTYTMNVYCGKVDGSDWYWLLDDSGNKQTVTGNLHVDKRGYLTETKLLVVDYPVYISFQAQCRQGYNAQPGSTNLGPWHRFKVMIPGTGEFFYANGRESLLWSFLSDITLKQDIQPLQDSLDKVSRLNGYSYSWRPDSIQGHLAGQTEYGVIAQQIKVEFPELVKQDDQGFLRVDYRGMIPVLLESIKELNARVKALEAQH